MSDLKSFVERIENLDAEQKGIGTDKREVFDEAAEAGYDKKAIRRLLRTRKEEAKDKGTAELAEQYRMLLSEPGATYRSVAEKTGGKRSTIQRLVVPRAKNGTEPAHDADGVITGVPPEEPSAGLSSSTGTDVKIAGLSDETAAKFKPAGPPVVTSTVAPPAFDPATDELHFPPGLRRTRAPAVLASSPSTNPDERAEGAA